MPQITALLLAMAAFTMVPALAQSPTDHGAWSTILERYVAEGEDGINRFAYGEVTSADRARLDAYIEGLEITPVSALPRDDQMAFWINLYNAVTVQVILEHYPVRSIRRIKYGNPIAFGPWDRKLVSVEGRRLSLNNIENDILRTEFDDNRIHYAINCASISCPNLLPTAFAGATLEAQLDAAARGYINHQRGVRVADDRLIASSIYNWFDEDFGGDEVSVLGHLQLYANEELLTILADRSRIDSYDYDWALNDAPPSN